VQRQTIVPIDTLILSGPWMYLLCFLLMEQ
jgi:hypothetical protein